MFTSTYRIKKIEDSSEYFLKKYSFGLWKWNALRQTP